MTFIYTERNIFYVAVTRSKKYLFLTYGRDYGGEEAKEVSVFINEALNSEYIQPFDEKDIYTGKHLPEFDDIPMPIVLNFSLLSNYFDCPYRFKLSNLYGFVQPYATEQGYGRMLHEIILRIHQAWMDGKDLSDEELNTIAEKALHLPFANSKQLEDSLMNAKECARAYAEQNRKDKDKIEAAEMDINIDMGDGVSINGRIDLVKRIDEDGSEKTAIVDLKSSGKDAELCLNEEQLKIYAIGYEEMTGKPADLMVIYNLDKPDGSGNTQENICNEVLEKTRDQIVRAANKIRCADLPRIESDKCAKCYTKHLCGKTE